MKSTKHLIAVLMMWLLTVPASAQQAKTCVSPDTRLAIERCVSLQTEMSPDTSRFTGGRYVWVPDSMAEKVTRVLSHGDSPDFSERVVNRGDTLPMVLKQRNLGRFSRGLYNYLFIPRGQWQFGVTASYGEISTENLDIFDLISDIDISGHIFSVKPYLAYFIRSNQSVGVRFTYGSSRGAINTFNLDIDEDMNFNLHDIEYKSESYSASLLYTAYYGIGRRGRFGVFNEVELSFGSGTSDFSRPFSGQLKKTHGAYSEARLNFSPGVCVFIMKNVSFNLSLGVFGFYLRNERQWVDGLEEGNRFSSGANFRFNIFNINFGLGIHI